MMVTIGEHTQTSINAYGDFFMLKTSKSFSLALDGMGRLTTGYAFTDKFMRDNFIPNRLSDALLSKRLIEELVRIARDTLPYKALPTTIFTDLGFKIEATILEWSTEADLYLLYVVIEGNRYSVRTNGMFCWVDGKGRIETTLLFCVPFYYVFRGMGIVTVNLPDGCLNAIVALLNGKVFNHQYLHEMPSVFFSYVVQQPDKCEVIGNRSLISELKRNKLLIYVK